MSEGDIGRIHPRSLLGEAPPEFGDEAVRIGRITIPLDTAFDLKEFEIGGNLLWAVDASSINATIEVRLQTQRSDPLPFSRGLMVRGARFSRLFITSNAQAGASITLIYLTEREGALQIANPAAQFNDVDLAKAATITTYPDDSIAATSTEQVLAAAATRREAVITNLIGNASEIRVGDSSTAVAQGIPLQPGESIIITNTDSVHVFNSDAGAQLVAVMELLD